MTTISNTIHHEPNSNAQALAARQQTILVDGHVHLHKDFCPKTFLEAAAANFQRAATHHGLASGWQGGLMLADIKEQNSFALLKKADRQGQIKPWSIHPTCEKESLRLEHKDGASLWLFAGRQILSAERIELLALATDKQFEEGQPLAQLLTEVQQSGALVVLPWSFGKWWFRRGKRMDTLFQETLKPSLQEQSQSEVFLGDNSLRPQCFLSPRLFRKAKRVGLRILPGSDPLAIDSHVRNAGRYGFRLQGPWDSDYPASSLKECFALNSDPLPALGKREHLMKFIRDQIALRRQS